MKLKIIKQDDESVLIRTIKDVGHPASISKICLVLGGVVKVELAVSVDTMYKGQEVILEV